MLLKCVHVGIKLGNFRCDILTGLLHTVIDLLDEAFLGGLVRVGCGAVSPELFDLVSAALQRQVLVELFDDRRQFVDSHGLLEDAFFELRAHGDCLLIELLEVSVLRQLLDLDHDSGLIIFSQPLIEILNNVDHARLHLFDRVRVLVATVFSRILDLAHGGVGIPNLQSDAGDDLGELGCIGPFF